MLLPPEEEGKLRASTLSRIHRIADRCFGLITREQLRALDLSDSAIGRLVEAGLLIRVYRGVYRLPGAASTLQQRALAAVWACGPGAVASGPLSADLWGLFERPGGLIVRKAIGVLRKARLPDPVREHPIACAGKNYFIDLAYPDKRIAIECRGESPHWGRKRFQYDIDRSNALELAGWDEYTFTWWHASRRTPRRWWRRSKARSDSVEELCPLSAH